MNKFKLLGIGNSFSDDAFKWVYPMIDSMGIEDKAVNNLYIGGCPLYEHLRNMENDLPRYDYRRFERDISSTNFKISEALKLEDWQYITLQQSSGDSGIRESFGVLEELLARVNALKPANAKLYWHMTWAYSAKSSNPEFKKYGNDQLAMYNALIDCVKTEVLKFKDFVGVIPSGTAIQNARTSSLGDNMDRDGFHLSMDLGRYIAGLCVVCTILGTDPADIPFAPCGVDPLRRKIAEESVRNAIKAPFEITPSVFR